MSDDAFNMSMRKFLKQLGVTSQQQIEAAIRAAGATGPLEIRATVTIPEIGMEHVVTGTIEPEGK